MIENRDLKQGMVLEATYKKKDYRCDVVKGEDGKLVYRLPNGKEFTSPSRAGTEVMGGVACNGWRFWSVAAGDDGARAEIKPAKKKKGTKSARALAKTKPQGKVKVGKNGHKPGPRGRGAR